MLNTSINQTLNYVADFRVSFLNSWPNSFAVTLKCSTTKYRLSSVKQEMSIGHLKTLVEHPKDALIQCLVSIREKVGCQGKGTFRKTDVEGPFLHQCHQDADEVSSHWWLKELLRWHFSSECWV